MVYRIKPGITHHSPGTHHFYSWAPMTWVLPCCSPIVVVDKIRPPRWCIVKHFPTFRQPFGVTVYVLSSIHLTCHLCSPYILYTNSIKRSRNIPTASPLIVDFPESYTTFLTIGEAPTFNQSQMFLHQRSFAFLRMRYGTPITNQNVSPKRK